MSKTTTSAMQNRSRFGIDSGELNNKRIEEFVSDDEKDSSCSEGGIFGHGSAANAIAGNSNG